MNLKLKELDDTPLAKRDIKITEDTFNALTEQFI